jgi:hypothetical protein
VSGKSGILKLRLLDVYENPINDNVDIRLRHQVLDHTVVLRGIDASKRITIRELHAVPQGLYRIEIDPPSYLPVSEFVNVQSGPKGTDRNIVFPINPKKIASVDFPSYDDLTNDAKRILEASDHVLGFEGKRSADLYGALDDIRRAGFLNIIAKCAQTRFSSNNLVIAYVQKLLELRGDRFFAAVKHELREEVKNSSAEGLFHSVSAAMHHGPSGFDNAGSFKTADHYGNLQLSFFTNSSEWVADIDIDDANGLEHVFQVLRNELTGRPTHPYDIHEILVYHQDLNPEYEFSFNA